MIITGVASDSFRYDDRSLTYVFDGAEELLRDSGNQHGEYPRLLRGAGVFACHFTKYGRRALDKQIESYGLNVSQLDCQWREPTGTVARLG